MTIDDRVELDVSQAAQRLLDGLLEEPWGQVSASVYETGRLVTLAPWLTGHADRVAFLIATQRPDGGWGPPDGGYALVPTLSATEALLSAVRGAEVPDPAQLRAARDGLGALARWLGDGVGPPLPDMPAVELIIPSLITLINEHLDADPSLADPALGDPFRYADPTPGGDVRLPGGRLPTPAGAGVRTLAAIRAALGAGFEVPEKLMHALEIAGDTAHGLPAIGPEVTGTIGASPAATAAWLGGREPPEPAHPARHYLEAAARPHRGPVPCGLPITVFERAWVVSTLIRAGLPITVPAQLVRSLQAGLGRGGTPAAAGLPADADTTAGALYALALLGAPHEPDMLWAFETETHFCTWPGEDGRSVSTNAHVLEAFGQYAAEFPGAAPRYTATMGRLATWLREQQRPDGSWLDRWHASPYYATACAALALHRFGGAESQASVRHAAQWLLTGQRADGSWGLWEGTAEETAYAVQILLLTGAVPCDQAVARAGAHLLAGSAAHGPAMWHDKDLYLPTAIVHATVLGAIHLTRVAVR
ncbi:prenyltransferase/squalene oxidase repeat-containing protein [Actinomadura scrupuli]|uniref:prenyltransferase/squalene oxidase repeat-containing protein n=1 Tax=Actinomadura scrupuli TaxID=559629 RepID=UPI003D954142